MKTLLHRVIYRVSFGLLLTITMVVAIGTWYFVFYCKKPLTFNAPIAIDGGIYKPGDVLTYTLDYCKHTDAPFKVFRTWKDGYLYNAPVLYGAGISGKSCTITKIHIVIPDTPPSKTYRLYLVWEYNVGPFLTRTVRASTRSFEIIDKNYGNNS